MANVFKIRAAVAVWEVVLCASTIFAVVGRRYLKKGAIKKKQKQKVTFAPGW